MFTVRSAFPVAVHAFLFLGWLHVGSPPPTAAQAPFAPAELLADESADPVLVRASDIDRDGDTDLVVRRIENMVWLEQTTPGIFLTHEVTAPDTERYYEELTVDDLDRDGDPDLVYSYLCDIGPPWAACVTVRWAENDGSPAVGTWPTHLIRVFDTLIGGIFHIHDLLVGDPDGDGDRDVMVSHSELWGDPVGFDGRLVWFESDGSPADGGWSIHVLDDWRGDKWHQGLSWGDLDADGDDDLVSLRLPNAGGYSVVWYENNGSPAAGEWPAHSIDATPPNQPEAAAVGDLDRDGDPDVVIGGSGGIVWYENDGTPLGADWTQRDLSAASVNALQLADLDGDGWLDVAEAGGDTTWSRNDQTPANGAWSMTNVGPEGSSSVALADLDGDGDPDLVVDDVYWFENLTIHRSALLRDEREVNTFVDEAYDVEVGDVDGDGDLDLVSAAEANDHVYFHRNSGSPGDDFSWNLSTLSSAVDGPRAVALGDLDADGDLDVTVASYNDDSVSWLENDGTLAGWTKRVISAGAGGAQDVTVADLDGDGDLDVACAQYLDDEVSWYRNNGGSPPTFSSFFVDSLADDGPVALAAGDLDDDGDLDLAVVAGSADTVVWYGNDGTPAVGEWTRHRTDNGEADSPRDVALADLDRDGDLDTLVANYVSDDVLWYENDGTLAGWTARTINGTCGGARSVAPGDFDGDGDLDLLLACFDDDALWLARSNGSSVPGFVSDLVTIGANGVRTAVAADLDRDGDLDGAAAQGFDDRIAWYENQGGQFRVAGAAIAADPLGNDAVQGVLRAVVSHRGRSGDGQMELAAVAVRLEESAGDPLSAFQAAALIDELQVFGDDGDGLFEPGTDPLLADASVAGIDGAGVVWVDLADLLLEAAIPAVSQRSYFVALDLANPYLVFAPATLRVTLLTDGDAVCEADDRDHQIPLDLQWTADVSTATLAVLDVLFRDSFETGNTTRWSVVAP